ncbi:hypothetical protein BGZ61DRAFT_437203 [Ilyonectria robusta]|uniref:uncharacterized protein n=1 Tax=Ilyonectria robusta TaxID=1079257 RepID=UPI001E8D95F6|nr:uncharacterized protein BGZ61DRAFT_437203 [Ilyonectria robusta]KAH8736880.1 hypothetical protein BGZ61DRAFT_437203 [Ilyonectria robusta]
MAKLFLYYFVRAFKMKPWQLALTTASLFSSLAQCSSTHHFDRFFPGWNTYLQDIIHNNCSKQFESYRTDRIQPPNSPSSLITPLIECILNNFPEFRKTELGASAVILGLLPTILQSLGSRTAESAVLARRRPFLAVLLAGGSPAVNIARGSEFVETLEKYVEGREAEDTIPGVRMGLLSPYLRPWISILEYLLVGCAVANIAHLTYRLGVNAVVGFAPQTTYLLPLWAFLAVVIHLGGSLVLHLRVTVRPGNESKYRTGRRVDGFPSWVLEEFIPCAFQSPKFLRWRPKETLWFPVLSWLLNLGILVHVVFGTLVMSSLLFFSVVDSVMIIARFVGSAIICRTVVRVELAGIAESMRYQGLNERPEDEVELTP